MNTTRRWSTTLDQRYVVVLPPLRLFRPARAFREQFVQGNAQDTSDQAQVEDREVGFAALDGSINAQDGANPHRGILKTSRPASR